MKIPPFFLLNSLTPDKATLIGRYIAFPVGRSRAGKYLLATCAHSIGYGSQFHHFQFLYPDGSQLPEGDPSTNYIMPEQLGIDLAIIEIGLDRQILMPMFKDARIPRDSTMSHVRNVCHRSEFDGTFYQVTSSIASETLQKLRSFNGEMYEVSDIAQMTGKVLPYTFKGLSMQSWPGVSGSPLWDQYGNIYGMVMGGNEVLTDRYPEYFLCYLPIGKLKEALKKFLGKEQA